MITRGLFGLLAAASLYCALSQAAAQIARTEAVVPLARDGVSRPTITVGYRWEYSYRDTRFAVGGCAYTLSVTRVTATRIFARIDKPEGCDASITGTMAVAPGSTQTFDSDFNHFYHSKSATRIFDFPLYVGKKWSQQYEYGTRTWRYTADLSATVDALEEVTVPAGAFESYRITVRREYRGEATGRHTQSGNTVDTFWYSPVVKNFVKRTYRDYGAGVSSSPIERELISYSIGQ
jgi:hypothetical protein